MKEFNPNNIEMYDFVNVDHPDYIAVFEGQVIDIITPEYGELVYIVEHDDELLEFNVKHLSKIIEG